MIKTTKIFSFFEKGIRETNEDFISSTNANCFTVCNGMNIKFSSHLTILFII